MINPVRMAKHDDRPVFSAYLRGQPTKRSIFVSYHHGGDRAYYDALSRLFADTYQVIEDNSVEREIDSDDSEYVIRKIREEFITGSSCTVVLCGADTPNRKFVDWEIKATLDKEPGLIAVQLPTNPGFPVPSRLSAWSVNHLAHRGGVSLEMNCHAELGLDFVQAKTLIWGGLRFATEVAKGILINRELSLVVRRTESGTRA